MPSTCICLRICLNCNQFEGTSFLGCYALLLGKEFLMFLKNHDAFIVQGQAVQEDPTTQCNIPEDLNLQQYYCENLKS
jgi:hypothetical protein